MCERLCKSLTHIEIPNSVPQIDKSAFLDCELLKKIVVKTRTLFLKLHKNKKNVILDKQNVEIRPAKCELFIFDKQHF